MSMRPLQTHATRSHRRLLDELLASTQGAFEGRWDPTDRAEGDDFGLGLLDVVASALHVLWLYQEAWADEGFLPSAVLDRSSHRLLAHVGYAPPLGTTATGLQHLQVKEGLTATLPPGLRLRSAPLGEDPEAHFVTLEALEADALLNELLAWLPPSDDAVVTTGAIADVLGTGDALAAFAQPGLIPVEGAEASPSDLLGQLEQRLAGARRGDAAAREAARARQKALQLAGAVRSLRDSGVDQICFDESALCADLAEAAEAAELDSALPGPLSESQEVLAELLRKLDGQQPDAVQALARVLARGDCESVEDWAARLDAMTGFLDALVAGLMQQARDQLSRLHGPAALRRLDAATRRKDAELADGVALPGTTRLYLRRPEDAEGQAASLAERLRPGAWLIFGLQTVQVGPDGSETRSTRWREAVRVLTVRDQGPDDQDPMSELTFEPPLRYRYPLANTQILGNNAVLAHGKPNQKVLRAPVSTVELDGPLAWVLDPSDTEGKRPLVDIRVDEKTWTRIDDLRFADPEDRVYAVEPTSAGGHRVRFGDGLRGTRLPSGAQVSVSWTVGVGEAGNRQPQRVEELVDAHPSIDSTTNPLPIAGGAEPETRSLSELKAGLGIHGLDRAVSQSDLRTVALGYAGVREARVLRNRVRRREQLRVVVAGPRGEELPPEELQLLRQYLQARVPAGITVHVANRTEIRVQLAVRLMIEPGRDPLVVQAAVIDALGASSSATDGLLHPDRTRLGVDVHVSEVYRWLGPVPGLVSSVVERLHRADRAPARADRIVVADTELALWAEDAPVELTWEEARDL